MIQRATALAQREGSRADTILTMRPQTRWMGMMVWNCCGAVPAGSSTTITSR